MHSLTSEDPRKLRDIRPLDERHLMLYLKDGEVIYRDDGTGPSAYQGHMYAEGDDHLVSFGHALDTEVAQDPASWRIVSDDDSAYGGEGLRPVAVFRKSKPNNADYHWIYKLDHWLFLKLPEPMRAGARYTVRVDPQTHVDTTEASVVFDAFEHLSEAIHVNLMGYATKAAIKAADLYAWMGDGGARDYSAFEGRAVFLKNTDTGAIHTVGKVAFWKAAAKEELGRNLTGSSVWKADFTGFQEPGRYRLVIDGVGASAPFRIGDDVYLEPFRTSLRGFYYMRLGEPVEGMTPAPRQPRFIPKVDPPGFTIYLTDVHPWDPEFIAYPGDTWDESHHVERAEDSLFWRRRLPGHPTNDNARGGHSDAFDWDRHLAHVSIIYDMLLPYLLTNGALSQDDLGIPESGNGIPDLLDEARNEVDFFLSLKTEHGYGHGLTNPCKHLKVMFQAAPTTIAAWANAANCAILADAFRISGHRDLMARYRDCAIEAYRFAERQPNQQLDDAQNIGDAYMRGCDFKAMAAAFLFNVTGDRSWETALAAESVVRSPEAVIESGAEWTVSGGTEGKVRYTQLWATAAYLLCPHEPAFPELWENMRTAMNREAREQCVRHIEVRPSRRASSNNHWQTAENLQRVLIAHRLSDSPEERALFEKAMLLEVSWGLGRNPSNMAEMTGLPCRCVVNCFTTGRNDGTPGLHPGHTPYMNIEPWSYDHNGGNPQFFVQKCYPDWVMGGWPHQEAHFDNRYCWSNSEFTPQQTMRGKMALYGYLQALTQP